MIKPRTIVILVLAVRRSKHSIRISSKFLKSEIDSDRCIIELQLAAILCKCSAYQAYEMNSQWTYLIWPNRPENLAGSWQQ
jgi:hypothetical protein